MTPDLRPTRHVYIRPELPWNHVLVLVAIAVLIGLWLAVGHS
jgi:hypothetical protein